MCYYVVCLMLILTLFLLLFRLCVKTGLLEPSITECPWLARYLPMLVPPGVQPNHVMNLTLINAVLMVFGPLREDTLCIILLTFQGLTCALGLGIRSVLVEWGLC